MRALCTFILTLAWALWFGGLMTMFVSVQALFKTDRGVAVQAAPMLFHAFERYQLLLAAVGIVAGGVLAVLSRSRRAVIATALLAVSASFALAEVFHVAPQFRALMAIGQAGSLEARRVHGMSMMLYVGEAILLFVVGAVISWPGRARVKVRVDE